MRIAPKIELDPATERELTALARRGRVEARVQQRARAVLLAAQGWQNKDSRRIDMISHRAVGTSGLLFLSVSISSVF